MDNIFMGQLLKYLKFIDQSLFSIWTCKSVDLRKSLDSIFHSISNSNNFIDRCKVSLTQFPNRLILIMKSSFIQVNGKYMYEIVQGGSILSVEFIPFLLVDVQFDAQFLTCWILLNNTNMYLFIKYDLKFEIKIKLSFVVALLMVSVQGNRKIVVSHHDPYTCLWEAWGCKITLKHKPIGNNGCYLESFCFFKDSYTFWVLYFHLI